MLTETLNLEVMALSPPNLSEPVSLTVPLLAAEFYSVKMTKYNNFVQRTKGSTAI